MNSEHEEEQPQQKTFKRISHIVLGFLQWTPMILGLSLMSHHLIIGCWAAFGCSIFLLSVEAYRHYARGTVKVFPKVMDLGNSALWASLGILVLVAPEEDDTMKTWNGAIVTGGLGAIVLLSLLIKKPFTMQYAMETVPEETWKLPPGATEPTPTMKGFLFVNMCITAFWVAIFVVLVCLNVVNVQLALTGFPHYFCTIIMVILLVVGGQWVSPMSQ